MRRWASLVLFALLLLTPAPAVRAQEAGPIYIVQQGDTLTGIALKFGTTVEDLVQANAISDPSVLLPGAQLIIPGFPGVSGVLETMEVGFGESLHSLSLRHGVAEDVLVRLNRLVSPGRIYVGQEMIIPQQEASALALSQATAIRTLPGRTLLETAVLAGIDPWLLQTYNQQSLRLWLVPGSVVAMPGGDRPASELTEPLVSVELNADRVVQGGTEVVRLVLDSPAEAEGSLGPWALHFFPDEELSLVALQGIHALAEPGLYDLEIRLLDSPSGESLWALSQPIRVVDGGYPNDPPLYVPPQTIDPEVTEPEDALIASIVSAATEERRWQGPFQFPVSNHEYFSSRFGSRRSYNNSGYLYYHTGLDFFYTSLDDSIRAPAPGVVVYAGMLTVRGNTTIIDHGWGVYSGYLHQSEILVTEGQTVETGDVIGRVGETGRVNGPHLHWEIRVGGVPVDPLAWVETAFP